MEVSSGSGSDRATLTRGLKACARCRTKRIKCLGGTPCRNCLLSQTNCIFPARKGSRAGVEARPLVGQSDSSTSRQSNSYENALAPPAQYPGYRRPEKQFGSRRQASVQPRTYRGNPSCHTFVEQLIEWTNIQLSHLQDLSIINFGLGTPWNTVSPTTIGSESLDLEISIDCETHAAATGSRIKKPMKLRLPPYNYSIRLIETLERFIGQEQHYFLRYSLRNKVLSMHQSPEAPESKAQGWLCRWLSLIALGELYSGRQMSQADSVPLESTDDPPGAMYYFQAVSLLQELAESPDIEYVETLCLLALYAYSLNKVNTAYMYAGVAMRAALALGLHRDVKDGIVDRRRTSDKVRCEHEKRVFWSVYYLDLMTTTATGRPWGILDGEITIDLPSSLTLNSNEASEFFDETVANAYLAVMRLRSQAYSALYGYAGKDCTPFSDVSFFDHGLDSPLSQAHLDKIHEFYLGFKSWEETNPPALKIQYCDDGTIFNLNRITGMLYLSFYQCILVILRPAVVQGHNYCFEHVNQVYGNFATSECQTGLEALPQSIKDMCETSFDLAIKMVRILRSMWELSVLAPCAFFEASFTFTAAIALCMSKHICTSNETYRSLGVLDTQSASVCQEALTATTVIMDHQISSGNVAAADYRKLLKQLETNLSNLTGGHWGL
ncbi:uncharacterized protein RAG0_06737 [Rhynchosporium agropyri]|uniref:Zn(2)-C6 fungal-type domain-containing protein n=1 Tax=Rhynchosporium agropyri TaxID=914238 RepID=A0A1E1KIH5_9HELO|nr:uncharacterized protein RAG0_06737 [Rhynchosporium agropyri]